MFRDLFKPTISYFSYLVMATAVTVAWQMDFSGYALLAWAGITVAGGFVEGIAEAALK